MKVNHDLVSVVVPIYNMSKLLNKCVDSITNQTYQNLEILLIDDGSTDDSYNKCIELKKNDERIIVLKKKNGGLSDARNFGIANSNGKYICFIDSDDYIENQMIEKLVVAIKKENSDIACCAKVLEFENKKIIVNKSEKEYDCFDKEIALGKMLTFDNIDTSACDKIFKKTLFKGIKFPVGKYYEDMGTIYKLICESNSIAYVNYTGYHYYIRNNSISHSEFNIKHIDAVNFSYEIYNYIKKEYPLIEQQAFSFYYLNLMDVIFKIGISNSRKKYKKEFSELKKKYNNYLYKAFKCKYISFLKKIMLLFIRINFFRIVNIFKNNK